jgi:hypothetical protein
LLAPLGPVELATFTDLLRRLLAGSPAVPEESFEP